VAAAYFLDRHGEHNGGAHSGHLRIWFRQGRQPVHLGCRRCGRADLALGLDMLTCMPISFVPAWAICGARGLGLHQEEAGGFRPRHGGGGLLLHQRWSACLWLVQQNRSRDPLTSPRWQGMVASETKPNFGHGGRWRSLRVVTLLKASLVQPSSPRTGCAEGNPRSKSPVTCNALLPAGDIFIGADVG
jgi:hypothetical protein